MDLLLTNEIDATEVERTEIHPASTLPQPAAASFTKIATPETAMVVGFDESGDPRLRFELAGVVREQTARSCITLDGDLIGCEVVVVFDGGDPARPIVIGELRARSKAVSRPEDQSEESSSDVVELDAERLLLSARKEIVLRCGRASIVLTRAGKILIRGAYVLNRSSGVNMIQGGSVQIN